MVTSFKFLNSSPGAALQRLKPRAELSLFFAESCTARVAAAKCCDDLCSAQSSKERSYPQLRGGLCHVEGFYEILGCYICIFI